MQQSNRPAKFLAPFAAGDSSKVEIPFTTADPTRASQSLGFPPLTGTPPEAGGVPPQREDFNGAMNQVARVAWWTMLGARFPYDNAFAADAAIGGYPAGALLPAADSLGDWISTADNNTANPDTAGTGWVPGYHYGGLNLTGQTGGTVTLTPAQAAKRLITVSGTLTANLVLVLPDWVYAWDIVNNTGGAFTVTIKTAGSAPVTVPQNGTPLRVVGNGSALLVTTQAIPNATTGTAGIQRNATNAEAQAATATDRTVTPANLAQTKSINWITGLQAALDSKLNAASPQATGGFLLRFSADSPETGLGSTAGGDSIVYAGGGTVYIRPNGRLSSVGQVRVAETGAVTVNGAVSASGGFQYGSSRTIKTPAGRPAVTPTEGLAQVLALAPVRFSYNSDPGRLRVGYYAEDVQGVIPEAVTEDHSPDAVSPLLLDDAQLLPAHTAAIQALYHQINELQARVAELEGRQA